MSFARCNVFESGIEKEREHALTVSGPYCAFVKILCQVWHTTGFIWLTFPVCKFISNLFFVHYLFSLELF